MPFEEKDIYLALGLEAPKGEDAATAAEKPEEGENEQEPAEPAAAEETEDETETEEEGEKEQEPAEPAAEEPGDPPETKKKPQTAEERRQQAAQRRQRELDAAVQQAVQAALQAERAKRDAEDAAFFQRAGLKNPLKNNAPITSREEYLEYQQAYEAQKVEKDLKAGKVTRETIEAVARSLPEFQAAQTQALETREAQQRAQAEADQKLIADQLKQIQAMDPGVESILQLADDPKTGAAFTRLVQQNNLSFVEAYILTHQDAIAARQAAAGAQRAEKNLRGKEHLRAAKGQNAATAPLSADELKLFRQLMPGMKDSEYEAWVNRQRH